MLILDLPINIEITSKCTITSIFNTRANYAVYISNHLIKSYITPQPNYIRSDCSISSFATASNSASKLCSFACQYHYLQRIILYAQSLARLLILAVLFNFLGIYSSYNFHTQEKGYQESWKPQIACRMILRCPILASDVVRPITELTFVEQPINDLVDEGVDQCVATEREDAAYSGSGAGEPSKERSAGNSSEAHPCCFGNSLDIHLPEQGVSSHRLLRQCRREDNLVDDNIQIHKVRLCTSRFISVNEQIMGKQISTTRDKAITVLTRNDIPLSRQSTLHKQYNRDIGNRRFQYLIRI